MSNVVPLRTLARKAPDPIDYLPKIDLDSIQDDAERVPANELRRAAVRSRIKAAVARRRGLYQEARVGLYFAAFCLQRLALTVDQPASADILLIRSAIS